MPRPLWAATPSHSARRSTEASRKLAQIDLDSSAAQEPLASSGYVCLSDPTLNGRRQKAAKAAQKKRSADAAATAPETAPHEIFLPTSGKFTKAELEAMGMAEDRWDGKAQAVYTDRHGRELVVLCGHPRDTATSDWSRQVATPGFELMQKLAPELSPLDGDAAVDGEKVKKRKKPKKNATSAAVTIGRRQSDDDDDAAVLDTLLGSEPFNRIAGFCNSILLNFAPRLHRYYEKTMDALFNWDPRLRRIFKRGTSVFLSCTFNFGPQTVTVPHLDLLNLAWGWCFITAFGNFDPDKGGHLILWDLKRIIRFPPGATIAIPSALLRHSNVTIQQDETRYSFTQFAAGGLFRFVESGFRLNASLAEQVAGMSDEELSKFVEERAARFAKGLEILKIFFQSPSFARALRRQTQAIPDWDFERGERFNYNALSGAVASKPALTLVMRREAVNNDTDLFFFPINGPEIMSKIALLLTTESGAVSLINGPEIMSKTALLLTTESGALSLINGPEIASKIALLLTTKSGAVSLINGPEIMSKTALRLTNEPTAVSLINGPEIMSKTALRLTNETGRVIPHQRSRNEGRGQAARCAQQHRTVSRSYGKYRWPFVLPKIRGKNPKILRSGRFHPV
ncbi:hypothetical protein HMN09_00885300 [Mycena chlorophos]|uniref:Uncharacterized protein n=1 Tax=Mycena chlorophos TaxID=658473 RepID=A0A8H6SNF0_MYCCL|nr:hypothetical protein HMN09_00885300 [Mycena chlorophos]